MGFCSYRQLLCAVVEGSETKKKKKEQKSEIFGFRSTIANSVRWWEAQKKKRGGFFRRQSCCCQLRAVGEGTEKKKQKSWRFLALGSRIQMSGFTQLERSPHRYVSGGRAKSGSLAFLVIGILF